MNRVIIPARQATKPGGVGSLESILGLLKSLKIRALGVFWSPCPSMYCTLYCTQQRWGLQVKKTKKR
jgi:hypothetical protein